MKPLILGAMAAGLLVFAFSATGAEAGCSKEGGCGGGGSGPRINIALPNININTGSVSLTRGARAVCDKVKPVCKGGKCGGDFSKKFTKIVNKVSIDKSSFVYSRVENSNNTYIRGGSTYVTVAGGGGHDYIDDLSIDMPCVPQEATLVRAIHAVCVDARGREYPAVRMRPETWLDSSYGGEIYRCIEGASLKAVIGDVVEAAEGMAGVYDDGEALSCAPGEALHHFKGGLVKCAPAAPVKECTERMNIRRWGAGDMFFSYRAEVCVPPIRSARASRGEMGYGREVDLSGMSLTGGVGGSAY